MNSAKNAYVIAIDGGGTHSRTLCCDLSGRIVAVARGDGTSPAHNADAYGNTQSVLAELLATADIDRSQIQVLAAGLAGLDRPSDNDWAEKSTEVAGISARKVLVNDSYVAIAGAFALKPGILSIAGTGTITTGLLETGEYISNYDFQHYSRSGGQYIGRNAVIELFNSVPSRADLPFLESVLRYFQTADLDQLYRLASKRFDKDDLDCRALYSNLAPVVTQAAASGSPIAKGVCDRAAGEIATAIFLVAGCFKSASVSVVLNGGVVGSPYMRTTVSELLTDWPKKELLIGDPVLPPVAGAALMALSTLGVPATSEVVENLSASASLY